MSERSASAQETCRASGCELSHEGADPQRHGETSHERQEHDTEHGARLVQRSMRRRRRTSRVRRRPIGAVNSLLLRRLQRGSTLVPGRADRSPGPPVHDLPAVVARHPGGCGGVLQGEFVLEARERSAMAEPSAAATRSSTTSGKRAAAPAQRMNAPSSSAGSVSSRVPRARRVHAAASSLQPRILASASAGSLSPKARRPISARSGVPPRGSPGPR